MREDQTLTRHQSVDCDVNAERVHRATFGTPFEVASFGYSPFSPTSRLHLSVKSFSPSLAINPFLSLPAATRLEIEQFGFYTLSVLVRDLWTATVLGSRVLGSSAVSTKGTLLIVIIIIYFI